MPRMRAADIAQEFHSAPKSYAGKTGLDGVQIHRLRRFVDDRGFFMEIYRNGSEGSHGVELANFWKGIETAQLNYSIVNAENHIKGLHYHLAQDDIWFCPPPSKMKIVLFDVRKDSPTFQQTQTLVAGDGQDIVVRIPPGVAHGYRPLTNPCSLLYVVTKTFDPDDPDEFRVAWDHPAVKHLWEVPNG